MSLTPKQKRFCEEYVIDLNATQAAIRAGYSINRARQQGSENVAKSNILLYISQLQKEIQERNQITVDEIITILAKQARLDVADLYNEDGTLKSVHEIPKDARLSLEELNTYEHVNSKGKKIGETKKAKLTSRQAAIDKLMRHLGGYNDEKPQSTNITLLNIDGFKNADTTDDSTIEDSEA